MIPSTVVKPSDVGFDSVVYPSFRPFQLDAIRQIVESEKKLVVVSAPTGAGKSVMGLAAARLDAVVKGWKTTILTNKKDLQNQYMEYTFNHLNQVLAKGRANYPCILPDAEPQDTAANAPCTEDYNCELKKVCPFYVARDSAEASQIRILNYPFYLLEHLNYGMFKSNALVCDEGHSLDDELLRVFQVDLTPNQLQELSKKSLRIPEPRGLLLSENGPIIDVLRTAEKLLVESGSKKRERRILLGQVRRVLALVNKQVVVNPWVKDGRSGISFIPVSPEEFASYLTQAVDKIVIMSATIFGPEYWSGVLETENTEYVDVPSTFPAHRRPIYIRPIVNVSQGMPAEDKVKLVDAVDSIIANWLPKKGLIHVTSYEWMEYIVTKSAFATTGIFITHRPGKLEGALEQFKAATRDAVLVSPAATEGLDLPMEMCEWIVFPKIPWLNKGDPIVKARMLDNPKYYDYKAMSAVIQGAGRGMRSKEDSCSTYVLDNNWNRGFYARLKNGMPKWFKEALVYEKAQA